MDIAPYSILVLFLTGLIAGVIGASLLTWGYRRLYLELEYRLGDLEARLNREVKVRAQAASLVGRGGNKDLEAWAMENRDPRPATPAGVGDFNTWWHRKMSGK